FLDGNRIKEIPERGFENTPSLEVIMLSDNPLEVIGSHAFTVPTNDLLVSLEEGKIGIMAFWDGRFNYTVRLGVGHDDSEYIDVSSFTEWSWINDQLLPAFKQSGFANQSLGKYKLLPCSLGWFVNASSEGNKCIECPAGGFYSDQLAFVNDSCLHCKNGTFVHYNNAPGKSPFDCKACPD
ncbi:unnamed protein product, partial [Porites lobata]